MDLSKHVSSKSSDFTPSINKKPYVKFAWYFNDFTCFKCVPSEQSYALIGHEIKIFWLLTQCCGLVPNGWWHSSKKLPWVSVETAMKSARGICENINPMNAQNDPNYFFSSYKQPILLQGQFYKFIHMFTWHWIGWICRAERATTRLNLLKESLVFTLSSVISPSNTPTVDDNSPWERLICNIIS